MNNVATSQDEIGHLTTAFNQMVEQLRLKERLRERFGKYVDPRVIEGLIEGPALAASGRPLPHKKKTPVGSGRFRSQLGGSWGLLYIHVATLGGW